jgi:glycosyltransferase involved in cell wall biosynthesis
VIHVNGVGASAFFCLHAARAAKAPVLLRLNREIRRKDTSNSVIGRALAEAAWVVAVSSPVLEQARRVAPAVAPRSSVVHSGVDVPARAPDRVIVEPPTVLCVGRLVRDKGFHLALDALPAILRRVPAARMRIAGDGPELAALRRQAGALGITEHVDFTGLIPPDEVSTLISAATIVVIPSLTEGLPMTALQASAMGRPIIASSVGGLSGIVRHGETGLLVDLDPAAIAAAVARLLEDPDEAARLGRAAWQRAGALFGIEQCADAYADLYRRLSRAA